MCEAIWLNEHSMLYYINRTFANTQVTTPEFTLSFYCSCLFFGFGFGFVAVLEFELRTLHFLVKCSTTSATHLVLDSTLS
jgi:hypothetical protein